MKGTPAREDAAVSTGTPDHHFWIVADSQLNNFAGHHDNDAYKDAFSGAAIRPPTLDLWSETLLSSVMDRIAKTPHVAFYLGDGANVSCLGEYQRFLDTMGHEPTSPRWFGVPGNHDGYYMGNLTGGVKGMETWARACKHDFGIRPELLGRLRAWEAAVLGPHGHYVDHSVMPKALVIVLYLANLRQRGLIDVDPLEPASWTARAGRWELRARSAGFSVVAVVDASPTRCRRGPFVCEHEMTDEQRSAAQTACAAGWRAFIVQDVALGDGTHAILADTSDFEGMPPAEYFGYAVLRGSTCILPGKCGRVSADQAAVIKDLTAAFPERYFAMGHHPWQDISVQGARNFDGALDARLITYLSGHTHSPTATVGFRSDAQWEINVGSTTDWPLEYAKVGYWTTPPTQTWADLEVSVVKVSETPVTEKSCALSDDSEAERADELYYFHDKYARRALRQYRRLIELIAKDPSLEAAMGTDLDTETLLARIDAAARGNLDDMLVRLRLLWELDRTTLRRAPRVLAIERSCAAWASMIDQHYYAGRPRRLANFVAYVSGNPRFKDKSPVKYGIRLDAGARTPFRVSAKGRPAPP